MKLAVPDLISPSYFPALAAAELGFFAREGFEVSAELIFPVDRAYEALRDGAVDFVGGAAHGALAAFTAWHGDRDRGDPRRRHDRSGCAARRRPAGLLRLHDAGLGDDRPADRALAGDRSRCGARAGRDAERAESRRVARHRSRQQALPAAR